MLDRREPLMRRALAVFVQFTATTGRPQPDLHTTTANYARLLRQIGLDNASVERRLGVLLGQHELSLR